jgi:hypothetical protein
MPKWVSLRNSWGTVTAFEGPIRIKNLKQLKFNLWGFMKVE